MKIDAVQKQLLQEVADLHDIPEGAYNLRANGQSIGRNTTANIDIQTKPEGNGIDIRIKEGTKNESVHIPVIVSDNKPNSFYYGLAVIAAAELFALTLLNIMFQSNVAKRRLPQFNKKGAAYDQI